MGILNVLRYDNLPDDVMAVRWQGREDNVIHSGSQLIVQQGQAAVFYRDGTTMTVFPQGRYVLTTQSIPLLTKFATGLVYGFKDKDDVFTAAVYFVNTQPFRELRWGTNQPVYMQDAGLNTRIPVRANGRFTVEISDPTVFCARLVGTKPMFRTPDVESWIREQHLIPTLNQLLAQIMGRKKPEEQRFETLIQNQADVGTGAKALLSQALASYGLNLVELSVVSISTTEEIDQALRELAMSNAKARARREQLAAEGVYTAEQLANLELMRGIGAGQAKGGGGGAAGTGGSMADAGMAMMMPAMMMQMMNQMKMMQGQAGAAPAPSPVAATTATAPAQDPIERLKRLKGLLDQGLISQQEFDSQKAEILKQI